MSVSVVVATHNRARLLGWLWDGLAVQTVGPAEIVVVDDASSDCTPVVARALARGAPSAVRVIRLAQNRGPAAARNAGWRAASGSLVAFVDDDCRPEPGWLGALVAAAATADVVQGRTVPDPAGATRRGPWSHTVDIERATGTYETCNIAYRRDVLERAGGFDESYRKGEDVDLGCRAVDGGARFAFCPDAVVHHDVSASSWPEHVRRLRSREDSVRAIRAYPRTRANLYRGFLFSEAHPPAVVSAVGVVAALAVRRREWVVVAALLQLPYLHHRVRVSQVPSARKWTWPWVIPLALVADWIEVGALARASVRWRTVVL